MAENDWAIVIGINQYDFLPADDHLKYAVNDAVKVRQFLCEQAKFPQENVLLCCDSAPRVSPQQRPNRAGLRHLLQYEIQRAKGANNFWFFYAGHGIVHERQDFLLPCDGNPRDLEQTAIPISFVIDCLKDFGAENVVLVMDMCRNCTRGTDEGSRDIGEVMGEQTQRIAKAQGFVTLFSCSRGERSYEIEDLGQGAFTYALLEGLKQGTTPRALEQYLIQRVPALNRQHGKNIQTPRVIPEPGWKYDRPLLLSCAAPADILQLALEPMDTEMKEQDYEKAKALWWEVIEADKSTQGDRVKARKVIDQITQLERQQEKESERQRQEIASEKGIDYTKLRDLLNAQNWEAADQETADRMCEVMGRQQEGWLREEDVINFPCTDLRTIDQLWIKHSKGKFGFSVQKKIWQRCGSPTRANMKWENFGVQVGWRTEGFLGMGFLGIGVKWFSYSQLTFDLTTPTGHLPTWTYGRKTSYTMYKGRGQTLPMWNGCFYGASVCLFSRQDL